MVGNLSAFREFAGGGFEGSEGDAGKMAPVMISIEQSEEEPSLLIFGNKSDGEETKLFSCGKLYIKQLEDQSLLVSNHA